MSRKKEKNNDSIQEWITELGIMLGFIKKPERRKNEFNRKDQLNIRRGKK